MVTEDLVITGTDGAGPGYLYAFDRTSGAVRWKHLPEQGQTRADLLRSGGQIFALGEDGTFAARRVADGELRWKLRTTEHPYRGRAGAAASDGRRIFFPGLDSKVVAADAVTGKILWERELNARISTDVAWAEGSLYVGSEDGLFHRLDGASGEILATLVSEVPLGGPPLIFEDTILMVGLEPSDQVVAIDRSLSKVRWSRTAEGSWTTVNPLAWNGLAVVGDNRGRLFALDPDDGEPAFSIQLEGQLRGIGAAGNTLLIGTIEGWLYAYAPPEILRSGKKLQNPASDE